MLPTAGCNASRPDSCKSACAGVASEHHSCKRLQEVFTLVLTCHTSAISSSLLRLLSVGCGFAALTISSCFSIVFTCAYMLSIYEETITRSNACFRRVASPAAVLTVLQTLMWRPILMPLDQHPHQTGLCP